jgi:hypothetical protein
MDNFSATEQAYKNGYEKGRQDALKWIPVTERLPDLELVEANQNDHNWYACLVAWRFSKDRISVRKAWYDGECFDDGVNGDITDDITHWMHLPQPPKGE